MGLDPFRGDVVIFVGRNRRRLKLLYADPTGLWLSVKRFTVEAMKTSFAFVTDPSCRSITAAELAMLAEGSSYTLGKRVRDYRIPVANAENSAENRVRNGNEQRGGGADEVGVR